MSKPFTLNRLPSSIREELLARRTEKPALTLNDHFTWLAGRGHQVSRSAIYRFLLAHDAQLVSTDDTSKPIDVKSIRLRCLMVAANHTLPGSNIDLIKTAEKLLGWVNQTESK